MKKTYKPIRNFQKKKYYTNRNTKNKKVSSWLDGAFAINPQTWECKHIPKK